MISELGIPIILVLLSFFILKGFFKRDKAPPGPFQWPIVGNIIQMAMSKHKLPHLILADLAEDYGEIMSIKMGVHNTECTLTPDTDVIVSSFEAIKATLTADESQLTRFNDFPFVHDRSGGKDLGMIFGVGNSWKELRKFSLRGLREYGFGKINSMEAIMTDELTELMNHLQQKSVNANNVVRMDDFFAVSVINVIWSFVTGTRFDLDDPELARLVDINVKIDRSATYEKISHVFPIVRHLAPKASGYTEQQQLFEDHNAFIRKFITKHRKILAETGEPQNFIEAFVDAIDKNKGDTFRDDHLLMLLSDLIMAGSSTTSSTLSYAILFMLLNPDVQRRVQEEISSVIPSGQFPTMSDGEKMPFTKATILEVMRLGDIVPIAPARGLTADLAYKNYIIPKGTALIGNMHPVFMDKIFWGDPEVFRPDRFLDKDMNIVNTERVTPFGFGSRICFGESMARNSLFIYFTTFLQNFEFQKVPNTPDPTLEPKLNVVVGPYPFDVVVKSRKLK